MPGPQKTEVGVSHQNFRLLIPKLLISNTILLCFALFYFHFFIWGASKQYLKDLGTTHFAIFSQPSW